MPVSIFTDRQTVAFPTLESPVFSKSFFVFLIPQWFTVFGKWAQLSGVLALYDTCSAHDKRMKFVVSAEHAYWTDV